MSSNISFSQYDIIFEEYDQGIIDYTNSSWRLFPRVFMEDSIYGFFPWAEIYVNSPTGEILDYVNFVEGMKFDIRIGNEADGYLGDDFIWSEHQFNDIKVQNFLSGKNVFLFLSAYYEKNHDQSRAWNKSIYDVVKDILEKDYALTDSDFIFMSTKSSSDNYSLKDNWYQCERNGIFIQKLADVCYNSTFPKSPFVTFFNLNGEFYFMDIHTMFKSQQPINTTPYILEQSIEHTGNLFGIQDYNIMYGGLGLNFTNYKRRWNYVKKDGTMTYKDFDYKDFAYHDKPTDKLLIRKKFTKDISQYNSFGLVENTTDEYTFYGSVNSLYRDSITSYRMVITVPFNPKMVSGKLIDVKIKSADDEKSNILASFSGKWLITKSRHYADLDGVLYSNAEIVKSTMYVDSGHPYVNDFQ
jgi:hypothetical protein